eukprot:TRINITY_DN1019_c0_g1_i5.p1 TRINITY_DN1019_c0_g1~~TRINITY_DN1019_c0_g1_i5.p1  ORF type:complete len:120 (-),score=25.99 TRINITY_DN1019_c0_g1_i5:84-443(-)
MEENSSSFSPSSSSSRKRTATDERENAGDEVARTTHENDVLTVNSTHPRTLTTENGFNSPIYALPQGLVSLEIGDDFVHTIAPLPLSLKTLRVGLNFDRTKVNLPPHCELFAFKCIVSG